MEHIHFGRDIPADFDHLPEIEKELDSAESDLQEVWATIARQKKYAIRNTILSAALAVGGIIGVHTTSDNDNERIFHTCRMIAGLGILGALYDGKKVISPGSYDIKTRLGILQIEKEGLLGLRSEIRHKDISL